jgi:murein DD-endopeptidase MepM/ murein hydrolase activator NlpD
MKKISFKIIIILLILLCINIILAFNIQIEPLKTKINNELVYQNYSLALKYEKLKKSVDSIENKLELVNDYDKYIHSQILGQDIDTSITNKLLNNLDNKSSGNTLSINAKLLRYNKLVSSQIIKLINTIKLNIKNKKRLNSFPNAAPIRSEVIITSKFGWRIHPIFKIPLFHHGVDITAPMNTEIYSTMDGIVDRVKLSKFGFGNSIIIVNKWGFKTLFAHLNEIYVLEGDSIKKNQIIGKSGNSGLSTAPHLHYEIREMDELKDPENFIFYENKFK